METGRAARAVVFLFCNISFMLIFSGGPFVYAEDDPNALNSGAYYFSAGQVTPTFDPNDYAFLVYDCGTDDLIHNALPALGIPVFSVRTATNPVTAEDLLTHDILIVSWNAGANASTAGLDPAIIDTGIAGRVLLTGHDLDYHVIRGTPYDDGDFQPADIMMSQAIGYILAGGGTGLLALADQKEGFPWLPDRWEIVTTHTLSKEIVTSFTEAGLESGVFDGLTPAAMTRWENSFHNSFDSFGAGFTAFEMGVVNDVTVPITISATINPIGFGFTKTDDVVGGDCRSPGEEITYTFRWTNQTGRTLSDVWILDTLPQGVEYPGAGWTVGFGDPNDPNAPPFVLTPPDPGYDRDTHTYVFTLGNVGPGASGERTLTVRVKTQAQAGSWLRNMAEIYAGEEFLAQAVEHTPVCCWETEFVIYVDASAADGGDGRSWPTAYRNVQDALARARDALCGQVYEVWVAQETYSPGGSESDTFDLRENISALYGGFPKGGSDFSQRDPKRYVTTLTGRIDATHRNDTVIVMGNNTVLDGFTISDAGEYGVYGSDADFLLVNCIVEGSWQYGIRATNGNVDLRWCTVRNNLYDGIFHSGAGFTVNIVNCWFMKQGRVGINCENTAPVAINSIVTESDLNEMGNAGIRLFYPSSQPVLQNLTIAHNKGVGVSLAGSTLPSLQNSIIYHNNAGGRQLSANLNPDVVAQYCCIADCNEVNNNINADPKFAYFDPNNVRIMVGSLCRDSGLTILDHYNQFDMDKRDRVLGNAVDRGAYEIECENTANPFDWNADGLVNYGEFSRFAAAFCGHDPNDPLWLANPELADPDLSQGWYEWKYKYNLDTTGDSEYSIDLADLMFFVEESPWLWCACWLPSGDFSTMYGEETLLMGGPMLMMSGFTEPETVSLPTVEEQIAQLASAIVAIQNLRLEPEVQQEIDSAIWNDFVDTLYLELIGLHWETQ